MRDAERRIGRLLIGATYVSVGLLVIGFVLMMADGVSPLAGGPQLDLPGLGAQLVALDPAGYLWLGLLAVIATPIGRVIVAGIAYAREAEWLMVGIALGILALMIVGVVTAFAGTV
ncbi:MAG: DUF1634 domain-containing protein [Chloroflexota bacterium]